MLLYDTVHIIWIWCASRDKIYDSRFKCAALTPSVYGGMKVAASFVVTEINNYTDVSLDGTDNNSMCTNACLYT